MFSPPRMISSLIRPVEPEVAVLVDDAEVARAEPAVEERLVVRLGVVEVARRDARRRGSRPRRQSPRQLAAVRRAIRISTPVGRPTELGTAGRAAAGSRRSGGSPPSCRTPRARARRALLEPLDQRRGERRAARAREAERRARGHRSSAAGRAASGGASAMPRTTSRARRAAAPRTPRREPPRRRPPSPPAAAPRARGHESVDVEERHRAEGDVVGRRARRSAGDRARRSSQVAVQERHLLRAARRAARVQEQRDVVRARPARTRRPRLAGARRARVAALPRRARRRARSIPGGAASRAARASPVGTTSSPRLEVVEVEAILVPRVRRD